VGTPAKQAALPEQINFHELSLDLARLDTRCGTELGAQLLQVLAYHFRTSRASLILLDGADSSVIGSVCHGFTVPPDGWQESGNVMREAIGRRDPLFIYNVHEHPQLMSPWPQNYRTDAFAVFPMQSNSGARLLLCLSNLNNQQLSQLENSLTELALMQSQVQQLCQHVFAAATDSAPQGPLAQDELALLSSLNEKLERGLDTRNVFAIFTELLAQHLQFDMLAVIHDRIGQPQQAVVCLQRPCAEEEVRQSFSTLVHQWQRRHKRAPGIDLADAALLGQSEPQPADSATPPACLGRMESFPVFIDNDLFGLVGLACSETVFADQRRIRLFSLLAHQLLLHVKKGLLLVQSQEMQTVDALTGLYSERHFYQMMEREFDRASRYNVPLCLLIMDVDHFKDVNEAYGFETGDLLLQEISRIIMENMRSTDFVSRYSGERFVLVLPETHAKNSEIMANRLRRYIENNSFFIPNTNVYIKVTVSLGVSSYLDHKPASLAQFIEFADTALYIAKRNGRNQVVGYSYVINMMLRDSGHDS
jgi:diguanylate cyclase (GGDEF)-like protein